MKFIIKKNYIILSIISVLLLHSYSYAKEGAISYKKENISNYFSGIVSIKQNKNEEAFNYLKKVQWLNKTHSKFSPNFITTLVLIDKFEEAFSYSKKTWRKNEILFEVDLLLGLEAFINEDYKVAKKHFLRIKKNFKKNLFHDEFIGNILLAWVSAAQEKKADSKKYLEKVPNVYKQIVQTQNAFLECYFDEPTAKESFIKIVENNEYDFSRYNYFLANYLLQKNKVDEAKKILLNSAKKYTANLLIKQNEFFLFNNKENEVMSFFSCQNSKDNIAEFFYILANLYSSEENYVISNFYLKISLHLNKKFVANNVLLAENYLYKKQYKNSKKIYSYVKKIGPSYSWYASKSISNILSETRGDKFAIKSLEKDFNSIPKPDINHYYDLANFYKSKELYKKSTEFYTLALKKINNKHPLFPKILERRGTSFERIDMWKKGEKDLLESLKILPDQPHVLNYLAYTWIDKGLNLDKALKMLIKANNLRKNDGYITDSLGWAYFLLKNYSEAEIFMQRAVELMPSDPVINDHYGDTLWMLNKNIQARYFWNYVLKLDGIDKELEDNIKKKLIHGINKKL